MKSLDTDNKQPRRDCDGCIESCWNGQDWYVNMQVIKMFFYEFMWTFSEVPDIATCTEKNTEIHLSVLCKCVRFHPCESSFMSLIFVESVKCEIWTAAQSVQEPVRDEKG